MTTADTQAVVTPTDSRNGEAGRLCEQAQHRLKPRRDATVRWSAWLGGTVINNKTKGTTMSMATLERAILASAKDALNDKLTDAGE